MSPLIVCPSTSVSWQVVDRWRRNVQFVNTLRKIRLYREDNKGALMETGRLRLLSWPRTAHPRCTLRWTEVLNFSADWREWRRNAYNLTTTLKIGTRTDEIELTITPYTCTLDTWQVNWQWKWTDWSITPVMLNYDHDIELISNFTAATVWRLQAMCVRFRLLWFDKNLKFA
jgi:hypothetical protein